MNRAIETAAATPRDRLLMDAGWRFHLGDIPVPPALDHGAAYGTGWAKSGAFQGAAHPEFNDSGWRQVDLPHDWVVEGTFDPKAGLSHGYLPTGVGWYRKTFFLPAADEGRRLTLEFEGIFRDATVYLNGHRLGHEPSGYIGYHYDITDQALYGDDNVLAVRVDAREGEGWWYEGAGIYRHVWLTRTDPVHVTPWGVFVAAEPAPDGRQARVNVTTTVANERDDDFHGELHTVVIAPDGHALTEIRSPLTVAAGAEATVAQSLVIEQPRLWSVDEPTLYRLQTAILGASQPLDALDTAFGVRQFRFDPDRGFLLNGQPLKLKGASNHQDHAGVGVAVPDRLFEFRIRRLKEMGANAWRCAHNPPAPAFLDACDRLGLLVMDETRCMNTTTDGRRQLESMVRRDRNHPSVILWSLGNEETLQGSPAGKRIIQRMKRWVRRLDPTRPVTLAMNGSWGEPVSPVLDVMGCNYSPAQYDAYHRQFPQHPLFGSETCAAFSTRGEYANDPARGLCSAYDQNPPPFGGTAETTWRAVADRPFVAGTFPWTGFDYRGEPAPGYWPCVTSNFGILDTCGFPKDIFHYYQAWWTTTPVLHIFPHWTWPGREGEGIAVWCYSNADEVELFLNGTSLGRRPMPLNGHLEWQVHYVPGTLSAVAYRDGAVVAEQRRETAGAPAALALWPDRPALLADGEDVAVVTAAVLDAAGRIVPDADNDMQFTVAGGARFLGTGNGNPISHEPDQEPRRRVFHGLCQVLLRAGRTPDRIVLTATAPGVRPATLEIPAAPATPRPAVPGVDPAARIELAQTGTTAVWSGHAPPDTWTAIDFPEAGWQPAALADKLVLASPSWVRVRFTAPAGLATTGLELDLGTVHDYDETWLNGVRLGSLHPGNTDPETAWKTRRLYRIPDGLVRPGAVNVIAIRAWNRRTGPEARAILAGPQRIRPAYA